VWFYTPMALPLLQEAAPGLVVYDCMDELSGFKNPPKQLLQRETALLNIADLVFTGGPSLYEAKRSATPMRTASPAASTPGTSRQALDRSTAIRAQDIPHPRLGFYGVIDERFDTGLIGGLADAHPEWQMVLVGPVVKIDPARTAAAQQHPLPRPAAATRTCPSSWPAGTCA
jgi:UDP-galactopyranose mutase